MLLHARYWRYSFPLLGLLALTPAIAEPVGEPPAELERLVPKGSKLLDWQIADLNLDGRPDALAVYESAVEAADDDGTRTLFIAIRQADGSLKVVKQNDKLVYCGSAAVFLAILSRVFQLVRASCRCTTTAAATGAGRTRSTLPIRGVRTLGNSSVSRSRPFTPPPRTRSSHEATNRRAISARSTLPTSIQKTSRASAPNKSCISSTNAPRHPLQIQ